MLEVALSTVRSHVYVTSPDVGTAQAPLVVSAASSSPAVPDADAVSPVDFSVKDQDGRTIADLLKGTLSSSATNEIAAFLRQRGWRAPGESGRTSKSACAFM